ncbi:MULTISPECIES: lysylphosphatidylglycerol synthase transmembrane domain-containing protein [Geobacter]|uniref:Membrane protein n=2 Tax=Geobacter TaxID=28231 RepID=A0A0C1TNX2_9BACT|nr:MULTISPECIES: lysylphosphatidylglycerol synthase transmembrane domain-containing protein [Geobacter]ANA40496.1 hypothetical protein A2G06_09550 [Geobacter anodireducens]KIE42524.1 membrane protein [Geobacter soli]MBE2887542.1 flippase-like domain-containing protein [Geobacter anodireducens]HMN02522.1 lysylphosphatidylglycerol synthase transmembrane domain-containing protein [Geobacter anodireducens]
MRRVPGDRRFWLGIGISVFFVALLVRSVDGHELLRAFRGIHAGYVVAAVAVTLLSYLVRALRWKYLLSPLGETRFANLCSATLIGYMANNLLPARLGEFIRAWVLARREEMEPGSVFATLVLDRLTDGFTVLLFLLATLFTLQLPAGSEAIGQGLVIGGYMMLGLYAVVVVALVLLKRKTAASLRFLERLLRPFPARLAERVIPLVGSFLGGVRISPRPREWWAVGSTSVAIWVLAVIPVDLVLRAFGFSFPFAVSLFILVLLVFAVMVPASPGYVGTYHAACVYGLLAFGVPRETALSAAIVIHGINYVPVIAVGIAFLWREGLSLKALRCSGPLPGAGTPSGGK